MQAPRPTPIVALRSILKRPNRIALQVNTSIVLYFKAKFNNKPKDIKKPNYSILAKVLIAKRKNNLAKVEYKVRLKAKAANKEKLA